MISSGVFLKCCRIFALRESCSKFFINKIHKKFISRSVDQHLIMSSVLSEDRLKSTQKDFEQMYHSIVDDLVSHLPSDVTHSQHWFKKVLDYNVPHGKKNRGLTVMCSYQCLTNGKATEEDLKISSILGWCIEMLQAFFLIADDIMDNSSIRRGQPCWYTIKGVGMNAVNDSLYIESAIYFLLKKHLRHKSYYVDIVDLFHETTLNTIVGQNLDMLTSSTETSLENFTLDKYNAIVKYKTAYYSFYLPVACALYMAGINDDKIHNEAKMILLKMGEYFQIQDDYLDAFGDPEVTGKIGRDIEENKCSWLIVQTLLRCDDHKRSILEAGYGQQDSEKVAQVKKIYNELNLKDVYRIYEEESYNELLSMIEKVPPVLPKDVFLITLAKIFKRHK